MGWFDSPLKGSPGERDGSIGFKTTLCKKRVWRPKQNRQRAQSAVGPAGLRAADRAAAIESAVESAVDSTAAIESAAGHATAAIESAVDSTAAVQPAVDSTAAIESAGHGPTAVQPAVQPAVDGTAAIEPAGHGTTAVQPAVDSTAEIESAGHGATAVQPAAHSTAATESAGQLAVKTEESDEDDTTWIRDAAKRRDQLWEADDTCTFNADRFSAVIGLQRQDGKGKRRFVYSSEIFCGDTEDEPVTANFPYGIGVKRVKNMTVNDFVALGHSFEDGGPSFMRGAFNVCTLSSLVF